MVTPSSGSDHPPLILTNSFSAPALSLCCTLILCHTRSDAHLLPTFGWENILITKENIWNWKILWFTEIFSKYCRRGITLRVQKPCFGSISTDKKTSRLNIVELNFLVKNAKLSLILGNRTHIVTWKMGDGSWTQGDHLILEFKTWASIYVVCILTPKKFHGDKISYFALFSHYNMTCFFSVNLNVFCWNWDIFLILVLINLDPRWDSAVSMMLDVFILFCSHWVWQTWFMIHV